VHLPRSEARLSGGEVFCSDAHRDARRDVHSDARPNACPNAPRAAAPADAARRDGG
jgi:hypothetical protein